MQISQSPQRSFSNWLLFLLSVCFLLGTGLKVAVVAAATWPTFQSNNQRNAFVASTIDPAELRQAWIIRSSEPPQPAWHGPAKWDAYANLRGLHSMRNYDPVFHISAAGEQLYFGSSVENSIMCLDAASGNRRWTFFTNGPVRIQPTLAQGRIYFGSDDGYAYCLGAEDGELIWRFRPSQPERLIPNNGNFIPLWPVRTGVTVSENTAYFAASLLPWHVTYLCAVDATTGRVTQPKHFIKEHQGLTVEGPLALSNDFVIAPQGRVEPMLFARETGNQVGKLEGGGGAFVVVADHQIVHGPGNKEGWLTHSDAATRERMATHKNARAIVVVDGTSYLLTNRAVVSIAGSDKSSK